MVEPTQTGTLEGRVSTFGIDVDTGSYPVARFQAAVAAFAEKLRGERSQSWGWIEEIAAGATQGRGEREELVELIRTAHALERRL